jgi:hypothetical protein
MSILPFTCSKPSGESRCFAVFVLESPLTPCLPAEAASRRRAPLRLTIEGLRYVYLPKAESFAVGGPYMSSAAKQNA